MSQSQRAIRSTRASQPIYRDQGAPTTTTVPAAAGELSDMEDVEVDGKDMESSENTDKATTTTTTIILQQPLPLSYSALLTRTRAALDWNDGAATAEEEEAANTAAAAEDEHNQQLNTSCLASLFATIPSSLVRELYAHQLSDDSSELIESSIASFLQYSDGGAELEELVRTVRAWCQWTRDNHHRSEQVQMQQENEAQSYSISSSNKEEDFWDVLRAARISPRNLVTFCYLLQKIASPLRLLAGSFYLSLLELATVSGTGGSNIAHEMVLRAVQNNVRAWARVEMREKEAGYSRKKHSKKRAAVAAADPFADEAEAAKEADSQAWMLSSEAALYIDDYISQCQRLYGDFTLLKYSELLNHFIETLIDLTRTDVEVTRKLRETASPLATKCYNLLITLLRPAHGSVSTTLQLLLKYALMSITLQFGGGATSATIPKHLMPIHRGAVAFVRNIVQHLTVSQASSSAVSIPILHSSVYHFVQHMLLRASDRADYRRVIAIAAVRDILTPLSDNIPTPVLYSQLRTSVLGFVKRMSCNKRSGIRLMALEVAEVAMQQQWALDAQLSPAALHQTAKAPQASAFEQKMAEAASEMNVDLNTSVLLPSDETSGVQMSNDSMSQESIGQAHAAILLSILVKRCGDAAPVVRARALSALAHSLSFCAEMYAPSAASKAVRAKFCRVMQERLDGSENGAGSGLIQRSVSAPLTLQNATDSPIPAAHASHRNSFSFLNTPLSTSRPSRPSNAFNASPSGSPSLAILTLPPSDAAFHPSLAGVRDILSALYRRAGDEKAVVRRAAIQALEGILLGAAMEDQTRNEEEQASAAAETMDTTITTPARISESKCMSFSVLSSLTASDLQIFYDGCFDRSLSIRKQSVQSLSALLRQFMSSSSAKTLAASMDESAQNALANLQRIWLGAVLPLIQDGEKSVVDKCVEVVEEIILTPLAVSLRAMHSKAKNTSNETSQSNELVWQLLSQMDAEILHYFQLILVQFIKAGQMSTEFIKDVTKEIERLSDSTEDKNEPSLQASTSSADRHRLMWVLMECMCHYSTFIPSSIDLSKPISQTWFVVTEGRVSMEESTLLKLLSCVGHLATHRKWKSQQIVEYASYLLHALTQQVSVTVKPKDASSVASPELVKKQIWILNNLVHALVVSEATPEEKSCKREKSQLPPWEKELLTTCERQLESFIAQGAKSGSNTARSMLSASLWNEPGLNLLLFTVGEIVLQHQSYNVKSTVSQNLLQLVQTFTAPTLNLSRANRNQRLPQHPSASELNTMTESKDADSDAVNTTQDVSMDDSLNTSAASAASSSLTQLSPSLRAHAFLTLGKMCLRSELLAKRCISLFIGELENVSSPLIQNNVLLILCDLCRTFTSIVDPYIPSITSMLASKNTLLRKHTIMVLNVLLQEEYLKLRSSSHTTGMKKEGMDDDASEVAHSSSSSMLYRYLRCLVDEDAAIKQLVQVSLKSILQIKGSNAPSAGNQSATMQTRIHMHFVELIYFLNNCKEHNLYNHFEGFSRGAKNSASSKASSNDEAFSLVGTLGSANATKRFTLYRYCLSLLSDEQKFILMGKFHSEILQLVNEDAFITKPWYQGLRVNDVIQDTLLILASNYMQLSGSSNAKKGDNALDNMETDLQELAMSDEMVADGSSASNAKSSMHNIASIHAQQLAKQKLLHKLLKKSTIDSCLPILFELRTVFNRVHSNLQQWLQYYFNELLKTHRNEMEEVFAGNKLLEKEVLFDLKRWESTGAAEGVEAAIQKWRELDMEGFKNLNVISATTQQQMQRSKSVGAAAEGLTFSGEVIVPATSSDDAVPSPIPQRTVTFATTSAATPLKLSSLDGLRLATPQSRSVMPSPIQRTHSTPNAAVAAALASPMSLRTPGRIVTPSLLRRTNSTPAASASKSVALRKNMPAGTSKTVEEHTSETDEEDGNEDAENTQPRRNVIVLPMPDNAPAPSPSKWNVALKKSEVESESNNAAMMDEATEAEPQRKKQRSVYSKPPSFTLPRENSLERLSIKDMQASSSTAAVSKAKNKQTVMKTESDASAAENARGKRKAAGLR